MKSAWAKGRAASLLAMSSKPTIILLALSASLPLATASPVDASSIGRRDADRDSPNVEPKIYVPVIIVAVIVFILVLRRTKGSIRKAMSGFALTGAAPTVGMGRSTGAPRIVTAEQLAGTINGEGAGTTAPTTRRPRRPRRTPSQMSVTSLPAYNKEPGEEELVIFRGGEMEDATMPAAVVRQSADESSLDHSQVSRYSPMPTSPHDMPLLNPDDTFDGDLSMQSLHLPATENHTRRNSDNNVHETSSLMRTDTNESSNPPDPRGEAPPYFEFTERGVSQDTQRTHASPSNSPEPPAPANRRSGFRTLLNRMSMVGQPNGHNRNDSNISAFSSNFGRDTTSRASNHRSNQSHSSLAMFRTISRQRSIHTIGSQHLTSPSMISLNSISPPLTHTVTRTEFTYPKTGPTAEQLKVISSRDAFSRFGVPYGEDAIAFASSSRFDLLQPPPDFATAASTSQLHLPVAGPSSTSPPATEPTPGSTPAPSGTAGNTPSPQSSSSATPAAPSPAPASSTVSTALDPASVPLPADSSSISKNHDSLSAHSVAAAPGDNTAQPSSPEPRVVSEFGTLAPGAQHDRFATRSSAHSNHSYATAVETLTESTRSRDASETASEYASGRSTPIASLPVTEAAAVPPVKAAS